MASAEPQFDGKFLTDTGWNFGSFAIMAATGVILNFFIAAYFGIETLGVFNQIYAVYVIAGQVAAMGVNDSAQKHNAEFMDTEAERDLLSAAAIWLAAAFGLATAAAVYLSSGTIGRIVDSGAVGHGVLLAAPGLAFFAVNKVLMGILNGRRRMKAFAAAQAFRVTVILVCCFVVAALGLPGPALGASFSVAEILLMPVLILMLRPPMWGFVAGGRVRVWVEDHLRFGVKALVNGFLVESYVRVDIIMLGIFVSDQAVGIYSFAALFIEGLYQVPVVVRTIANPVLVRLLASADRPALVRFCRRTAGLGFAVFAAAAGAVVVVYPYLAPFFPEGLVTGSYPLLMILAAGLAVYSVFIPLDYILLQAGQPGRQSLLMTTNVFANVALNLALIPFYGIWGAAVATAFAFTISSLNLNLAAWRWLGLRGGVLLDVAGPARRPT
ncbi:MAG: hypothetical protein CMM60_06085 [Rhodospirillaceae bacterium]|jgi:O-antigen/teichoic acid export membrane protein|nr:hypothetical protein [Rhodospirillaceae bacterium]|tara:strand:- start:278 stop:1597 length:1320 start_codon:yes stop_codon:yes gene_type:complete